jgi:MFS family permease
VIVATAGVRGVTAGVVRNRPLRQLQAAYLAFNTAEYASWIALLVCAYGAGGTTTASLLTVVLSVPAAVGGPIAARLGDRRGPGHALSLGYAVQAATTFALGAAIASDARPGVVCALAVPYAIALCLVRPTHPVLVPLLVCSPRELVAANAAGTWMESLGEVAGPALGGVVIGALGPAPACFAASR